MNKKAIRIVLEGIEGCGKTTQTQKLANHLKEKGYRVLVTKEPGTPLSPLTMQLRNIMLDKQYDNELTPQARELVSQAIRSIHLDKVITPALQEYDYIIQDRGIISGLAYGSACGIELYDLDTLKEFVTRPIFKYVGNNIYDYIIYLKGDPSVGLNRAKAAKQEFAAGDAMEAKGESFMEIVSKNMDSATQRYNNITKTIYVDGKDIERVFNEILHAIDIVDTKENK